MERTYVGDCACLARLLEHGEIKRPPLPTEPQAFTFGRVAPEHPNVIHVRLDHVVPRIDGKPTLKILCARCSGAPTPWAPCMVTVRCERCELVFDHPVTEPTA